jgi:cytochrome b6-f complex iron-sulfur subunit
MNLNRRDFLVLSAALAAGCAANQPIKLESASIDAGPASDYVNDGVYTNNRSKGFFIIRRSGQLVAISSVCTHKGCKVNKQPDQSFRCPCHGSTFDQDGQVTHGPATQDLAILPVTLDSKGHLIINALATT